MKILTAADYNALTQAMRNNTLVLFDYFCGGRFTAGRCKAFEGQELKPRDRTQGIWLTYRRIIPKAFFFSGEPYLTALHELFKTKETFIVRNIKNVREIGNLLTAITDPEKYRSFWDGSALQYQTTIP